MPKNFIKTLVQYKIVIIIGGILVVVIVAVLVFTLLATSARADIKIEVKPTLSLGPCFNNQIPPKTTIASPADGSRFTTGDKVTLAGIAVLECNNSKLAEQDLSWYLDTSTTAFATGYAYSLDSLSTGDHKIKLVSTSGKLKGESTVTINVSDPKPQVLGVKTPPPAPQPPPNQTPTVSIVTPSERPFLISTTTIQNDATGKPISYDVTARFVATANDQEDGPITIFKWFVNDQPVQTGSNTLSYTFSSMVCAQPTIYKVKVQVTDSKGLNAEDNLEVDVSRTQGCPGSAG